MAETFLTNMLLFCVGLPFVILVNGVMVLILTKIWRIMNDD